MKPDGVSDGEKEMKPSGLLLRNLVNTDRKPSIQIYF
jgi:hypothetical protein